MLFPTLIDEDPMVIFVNFTAKEEEKKIKEKR